MPDQYSNFTQPDSGNSGRDERERMAEGGGGYWDQTQRKWIRPEDATPEQKAAWLDPEGKGAEGRRIYEPGMDVQRYEQMGAQVPALGPQIDQARANEARRLGYESRDQQTNAANMLRGVATGAVQGPGSQLVQKQGYDASLAQRSMAASVRGGAAARAAAGRSEGFQNAKGYQRTNALAQQVGAREMADARGQYFGATTAIREGDTTQRNQDIGVATDQAKLNAGQQASNEQRDQFYEDLRFGTKKSVVDNKLQRSDADANAAQANREASRAEAAAAQARTNQATSAVVGGASGAMSGYAASQKPERSKDPWDPSNYSGSDENMKANIVPLYEAPGTERHYDRDVSSSKPDVTSGASLSGPTPRYSSARHDSAPKAKAAPPKARKRDDDDLLRKARAMLGEQDERSSAQLGAGPSVRDRDIMSSDAHAKQEAYALGRAHQWQQGKDGKPVEWAYERPDDITERGEMSGDRGRAKPAGGKAAGSTVARAERKALPEERPVVDAVTDVANTAQRGFNAAVDSSYIDEAAKGIAAAPPDRQMQTFQRERPPPQQVALSDERSKSSDGGAGAMAAANRSMAPSSYEYKPGFAEQAGQSEGERNVGPMAQNMAADPVAGTAIVKDPNTGMLAIDKSKGLKVVMGGLADVQMQLDELKKRKAAR